jgi:hypothetical protein
MRFLEAHCFTGWRRDDGEVSELSTRAPRSPPACRRRNRVARHANPGDGRLRCGDGARLERHVLRVGDERPRRHGAAAAITIAMPPSRPLGTCRGSGHGHAAVAAAVLAKGPVGFVLPWLVVLCFAVTRDRDTWLLRPLLRSRLVVLPAAWYVAAFAFAGDAFAKQLVQENFQV